MVQRHIFYHNVTAADDLTIIVIISLYIRGELADRPVYSGLTELGQRAGDEGEVLSLF